MTHAVAKIVAIKESIPAAIGFGVHSYEILDQITPMKTIACSNFSMGRA